jgi:type IV pilus assembly protein PilC
MPNFTYQVKDSRGNIRQGEISSPTKNLASARLRRMRFKILKLNISVEPGSEFLYEEQIIGSYLYKDIDGNIQLSLSKDIPSAKDVIVFTKQLATMLSSGVELIKSLEILLRQQRSKEMRKSLYQCLKKIESGSKLAEAFAEHPLIFDELYIAMLEAGEKSGKLDHILSRLVSYIEKSEKIKAQVKSAMAYPLGVLVLSFAVVSGLMVYVVPTFAEQYTDSGKALPFLTQIVIDFSTYFSKYWLHIIGSIVTSVVSFKAWVKTEKGKVTSDAILLRLPYIGPMLKKVSIGRFCSTLSNMLSSGVNLLDALTICASSSGNRVIETFILGVRGSLEKGEKFSTPLSQGGLFPEMVVSMVSVGESTGSLDDMLIKVSEYYEEEVDEALSTLLALIEPAMITFLGVIIGFIVIAMYLPVFEMAGSIS